MLEIEIEFRFSGEKDIEWKEKADETTAKPSKTKRIKQVLTGSFLKNS